MAKIAILKGDKLNDKSEAYATFIGLREIAQDDYVLIPYAELVFTINDNSSSITYNGDDLKTFDLVYIRDFQGYEFERNAVAYYLDHANVKYLNSDVAKFQHISKLTQYMAFSFNAVAIPRTVFAKGDMLVRAAMNEFTFPIILKSITGNSGNDNFMVKDEAQLRDILGAYTDIKFVAQEFIPNQGDLRMIVLGDTVECVYSRVRKEGDHRNNVSQGGDKTYLSLDVVSDEHKQLAVRAAKAVGREICGVDVMINDATGAVVILEANFNFGIRAVPGTLSDELYGLASYLHERAQN
jgi:RimK family alpha-L-glutamate ligase